MVQSNIFRKIIFRAEQFCECDFKIMEETTRDESKLGARLFFENRKEQYIQNKSGSI